MERYTNSSVSRHETDPYTGHVVFRASMEKDIQLMKRHLQCRTYAHYPNDHNWRNFVINMVCMWWIRRISRVILGLMKRLKLGMRCLGILHT